MKKYLILIAVVFISFGAIAQTQQKIGFVETDTILKQFSEAIKAQGDIQAYVSKLTAIRDSIQLVFQQDYSDYQKQMQNIPEDKKKEIETKLVKQEQDLREFNQINFAQGTGEIYKKQAELMQPVEAKIFAAIEKVAKSEGLQFVFDKAGDVFLLYADPAFDITFKVLDSLKRGI